VSRGVVTLGRILLRLELRQTQVAVHNSGWFPSRFLLPRGDPSCRGRPYPDSLARHAPGLMTHRSSPVLIPMCSIWSAADTLPDRSGVTWSALRISRFGVPSTTTVFAISMRRWSGAFWALIAGLSVRGTPAACAPLRSTGTLAFIEDAPCGTDDCAEDGRRIPLGLSQS